MFFNSKLDKVEGVKFNEILIDNYHILKFKTFLHDLIPLAIHEWGNCKYAKKKIFLTKR